MSTLSSTLGFSFINESLCDEALTHGSSAKTNSDYERLEFLGDAILKFILTEELFRRYPDKTEGELSALRAVLGSDILLGKKAVSLGISPFIHVAPHEDKLRFSERILGDVLEALFGALYLDQGLEKVRAWILGIYASALDGRENLMSLHDYKTKLQEQTQAENLGQPTYSLKSETGPIHERLFTVIASITRNEKRLEAIGTGKSKKQAEQIAAKGLLKSLELSLTTQV